MHITKQKRNNNASFHYDSIDKYRFNALEIIPLFVKSTYSRQKKQLTRFNPNGFQLEDIFSGFISASVKIYSRST